MAPDPIFFAPAPYEKGLLITAELYGPTVSADERPESLSRFALEKVGGESGNKRSAVTWRHGRVTKSRHMVRLFEVPDSSVVA